MGVGVGGHWTGYLVASVTMCVVSLLTFRYLEAKHVVEDALGDLSGYDSSSLVPLSYAVFSASLGTQSIIFSKSVSLLLRAQLSGDNMLVHWQTYTFLGAFVVFACFWVNRLNHVSPPPERTNATETVNSSAKSIPVRKRRAPPPRPRTRTLVELTTLVAFNPPL